MANVNIDPTPMRSLSQKNQVLAILQAGGTPTPRKARKLIGTYKLATRDSELILEDRHRDWEETHLGPDTKRQGSSYALLHSQGQKTAEVMRPQRIRRARRLLTKRWFILLLAWKYGMLCDRCERKIFSATPDQLDQLSENKTRYAIKHAWYSNKLNK